MRAILFAVYGLLAYHAVRAALRWLIQAPRKAAAGELVLDPECGVYIPKDSAVVRRVNGAVVLFCGEKCAAAHEAKRRT